MTSDKMEEGQLREIVAMAGKILYHQRMMDYLGHLSVRIPNTDRIVIKPKFSPRTRSVGSVGPKDLIVIDLDGHLLEGEEQPPAEFRIHTEIYRARPDVSAVVHTHQPSSTLLGVIGAELLPLLHIPSVLTDGGVATWPSPLMVTTQALGQEVAAALGNRHLCHLQGHGIVAVAQDLREATLAAIAFEQLAEANLRVLQTGLQPRAITREELDQLHETAGGIEGRWAYYQQLVEEG